LFEKSVVFALFVGMGSIVTAASWVRAESFVMGRAGYRLPSMPGETRSAQHRPPAGESVPGRAGLSLRATASELPCAEPRPSAGVGGIPFLVRTSFVRRLSYLGAMVALITLLSLRHDSGMPSGFTLMMLAQMGSFMSFFFIVFDAMAASRQLRLWRTLPISATRLAAVIIALVILPLVAVGGLSAGFAGLAWGKAAAITTLKSYGLVLAPVGLSMVLIVWLGTGRGVYTLLFLVVTGSGVARPFVERSAFASKIPVGVSSALVAGFLLLSFLLIRLVLARSSHAYRAQRRESLQT
jgi:hypothetical protein